jgi:hypothetical protein
MWYRTKPVIVACLWLGSRKRSRCSCLVIREYIWNDRVVVLNSMNESLISTRLSASFSMFLIFV